MNDLEKALANLPAALADTDRLGERVDLKQRRIELTLDEVSSAPHIVWNAFIALLETLPYEHMSALQRSASLAFFYDGEVQNGGHLQFFLNNAHDPRRDVPGALDALSLPVHAELLRKAYARWTGQLRRSPTSAEEFTAEALDGEFEEIDSAYHELSPSIGDALQSLLDRHRAEFVRIR